MDKYRLGSNTFNMYILLFCFGKCLNNVTKYPVEFDNQSTVGTQLSPPTYKYIYYIICISYLFLLSKLPLLQVSFKQLIQ